MSYLALEGGQVGMLEEQRQHHSLELRLVQDAESVALLVPADQLWVLRRLQDRPSLVDEGRDRVLLHSLIL